jgi:hypothetical protein
MTCGTKGEPACCLVSVGPTITAKASSEGWRLRLRPNITLVSEGVFQPNQSTFVRLADSFLWPFPLIYKWPNSEGYVLLGYIPCPDERADYAEGLLALFGCFINFHLRFPKAEALPDRTHDNIFNVFS